MSRAEISDKTILQRLRNAAAVFGIRGSGKNFPYHVNTEDAKVVIDLGKPYEVIGAVFDEADGIDGSSDVEHFCIDPASADTSGEVCIAGVDHDIKVLSCEYTIVYDAAATVAAEIAAALRLFCGWFLIPPAMEVGPIISPRPHLIFPNINFPLVAGFLRYSFAARGSAGWQLTGNGGTVNGWDGIVPAGWTFGFNVLGFTTAGVARVFPAGTLLEWHMAGIRVPRGQGFPF